MSKERVVIRDKRAQGPPAVVPPLEERLAEDLANAETRAWEALGRYKFVMFGYWAGVWVHLNRISGPKQRNPFRALVDVARAMQGFDVPASPPKGAR